LLLLLTPKNKTLEMFGTEDEHGGFKAFHLIL